VVSGPLAAPDRSARLRLGVVAYLNMVPLIYGLDREPGFELVRDVPARLAERLHAGELDLGMIPAIELCDHDYAIVPGIAIGCRGPVASVRLVHRVPLLDVRSVALDRSSRTSAALLRLLLRERLGHDPMYLPMAPDVSAMLERADAALVIGDPALDYAGSARSLDLGQAWLDWTGLPFVFAVWAGRPGAVSAAQVARLQAALHEGLGRLPELAARYNGEASRNEAYLRTNVHYGLGESEIAGLRAFHARAQHAGLIHRVPELRFHGDS
jgi:chorismate dehydratase